MLRRRVVHAAHRQDRTSRRCNRHRPRSFGRVAPPLSESGVTNCDYVAGDAYDLAKLVPRNTDFVFMANAFHGVPDRPRLALAVHAVLKPGGLFAIINWHQRPREETVVLGEPRGPKTELRLSPEQTAKAIEPSGLKLAHLVEVAPYHYGAVFEQPLAREQ
jgi:ubiquinone/menaquinone biosynthesis C-methylase UbiE